MPVIRNILQYVLGTLGEVYLSAGNGAKAVEFFNQVLGFAQNSGDPSLRALALYNIGFVYWKTGDNNRAIDNYNQALSLYENLNDRQGQARALLNLALVYETTGDKKKAKEYRKKAERFK